MFIRLLTLICAFLISLSVGAATCQKTGQACVDSTPCKNISGVYVCLQGQTPPTGGINVAISCWKYTDTYNCIEPNAVNYCAGLEALQPMCYVTGSSCVLNDTTFGTGCMRYQETWRCGDSSIATPTNTVRLGDTYTITYDGVDRSACATVDGNASCTITAHTCVDGPATKNINGLDVYKDCWEWKDDYSCVVSTPLDYCAPLESNSACSQVSSTCSNYYAPLSTCLAYDRTFNCNTLQQPPPTNVIYLNSSYTIIGDTLNTSQCTQYSTNPNCALASHTCIDGPGTRNINGLDVYKDCWEWKDEYTCTQTQMISDCDDLRNNPACAETGSACLSYLADNTTCSFYERQFSCAQTETSTVVENCSNQSFCIGGSCFDASYPPDPDFGRVASAAEALREISLGSIFGGQDQYCSTNLLSNCCKTNTAAASSSDQGVASMMGIGMLSVGTETIRYLGSPYVYSALMDSGYLFLQSWAAASNINGLLSPDYTLSYWGVTLTYSDGVFVWGFDPTSLAISVGMYLLSQFMACDNEEAKTGAMRGQGLCHHTGTFCTSSFLGSCLAKKQSYCCFSSRLSRIINEQGRAQIGKSWGSAQSPNCSGFTLEEIEQLNFDTMDFSEFVGQIMKNLPAKSQGYASQRATERAASYYAP